MENIFTFGEYDLSKVLRIDTIERPVMDIANTFLEVKGSANRFLRNKPEGKEIIVTATYRAREGHDEDADLFQVLGDGSASSLARMLYTKEPTKLVLGDRPQLFDMAVIDGEVSAERFFYITKYKMKFVSPYPYSFGAKVEKTVTGTATIENTGDFDVYPMIHLPNLSSGKTEIINSTTGDTPFRLNYTQFVGSNVYVDNENMTCTIAKKTSIEKYIPLDSRWIRLAPGTNTITVSPSQSMTISFYPKYQG